MFAAGDPAQVKARVEKRENTHACTVHGNISL